MEIFDTVDINQFENSKLQEAIRICLVTDINLNPLYNKLYSNFLKSIQKNEKLAIIVKRFL